MMEGEKGKILMIMKDKSDLRSVGANTIIMEITQRETKPPPFTSPLRTYLAQYLRQFMLAN